MRNITRSLIRVLTRSGYEPTPFPKGTDDVQLVNLVQDTSHLAPVVTNATRAVSIAVANGGVGTFAGIRLQAPASKTIAVYAIENLNSPPATMDLELNNAGVFTPSFTAIGMAWGDEGFLSVLEFGTYASALNVFSRFAVEDPGESPVTPVFVAPGETLAIAHRTGDTTLTAAIALVELG